MGKETLGEKTNEGVEAHLAMQQDEADDFTVALTPQTDDPHTPAFTFRAVLIGSFWGVILACANILFSFRTVAFSVPTGMAQLLSYPMGIFLAYILPRGILNPGPFSIKEHVLIYIIAGSAGGKPYGVENVIGTQPLTKASTLNRSWLIPRSISEMHCCGSAFLS